ncbi:MAG: peptide ABC transporter substrate-binding protein [Oscillospiraceae bacterium]
MRCCLHLHLSKGAIAINLLKKIIACAVAAGIALTFTACGDGGRNEVFKYSISANPKTLDPQQANELNSNTIIENVYMGLMAIKADGSVGCGAAESYTVSEDGLHYSFTLRQDVYWKSVSKFEAQCTANDYVYGFKRLFDSPVKAPRASDYYCIKNSKRVHTGELSPSSIGVKAKGDFELEITLEYPNPRFLAMLAEPPAMPCNEEFFNTTHGKYGLSAECTASNGAFYVRSWNYDRYSSSDVNNLILSRNSLNAQYHDIAPSGLNYFIDDKENFISDFLDGVTNCVSVSNEEIQSIKSDDIISQEFCNVTCGIVFNKKFELFRHENFLKALTLLVNREDVMSVLPDFEVAQGIVPKQVLSGEKSFRETVGVPTIPQYDSALARELFKEEKSKLSTNLFTGARVIVNNSAAANAVSYILQEWQREFGFYCVVEELDDRRFNDRLQSGDYEIAVVELAGKYNSAAAYLEQFCSDNSANYWAYFNAEFDRLVNDANEAADPAECDELFKKAEQMLIDKSAFIPLYYKNEYFLMYDDCQDIIYNPFSKTVNFVNAKKD